ncbi:hypothetical protein [Klebsiella pneumoniae]|uniref:hypothetical protein n=1 Tax=Klebsiella pneumoniae TaxID=573 RepID=UPI003C6D899F
MCRLSGVAKKRLCGKIGDLGDEPGALAPLMDKMSNGLGLAQQSALQNPCFLAPATG